MEALIAYARPLAQGAVVTVGLAVLSLALATLLGGLGAYGRLGGGRFGAWLVFIYTTIVRGIPDLVVILLVYFGGQRLVNTLAAALGAEAGFQVSPFVAGTVSIGFIYGAYLTETFRGAMLSIPKGQAEAAWAFGMGRLQTFMRITAPQMVRYALPGFTNNWLVLIKATALVSLIGLQEMTYAGKQAGAATRSPLLFLLFTASLFLVYTAVSLFLLRKLTARFSLGTRRGTL